MIYCYHCTCFRLSLFSDINISQGSVATLVRCGGIFNANFSANFMTSQPTKELWKSADIWRSYRKSKKGDVFLRHSVLSESFSVDGKSLHATGADALCIFCNVTCIHWEAQLPHVIEWLLYHYIIWTTITTTTTTTINNPLSGTTQVSRYQKDKPFWILLKQTWSGGSGIS